MHDGAILLVQKWKAQFRPYLTGGDPKTLHPAAEVALIKAIEDFVAQYAGSLSLPPIPRSMSGGVSSLVVSDEDSSCDDGARRRTAKKKSKGATHE